jgi:hypothetical protein
VQQWFAEIEEAKGVNPFDVDVTEAAAKVLNGNQLNAGF